MGSYSSPNLPGQTIAKDFIGEQLKVYGAYLLTLDTFLIAKAGTRMLRVQKWKDHSGNPDRGEYQVGHHWALGALLSRWGERFLSWPVVCRLLSGQLNPCCFVGSSEGLRPATFWDGAIAVVFQMACLLGGLPTQGGPSMRVVVDAFFSKAPFLNPMIQAGIGVISRLRDDAVGWDDAKPYSGRGRLPKWGRKWKLAELLSRMSPQVVSVTIYGKAVQACCIVWDVWLRDVCQKVRVVVIKGTRRPILLVSTDLSLSAVAIIEMYAARFSIEIAIRDLNQHFGIGDYQTTTFRGEAPLSFARAQRSLRRFVLQKILFSKYAPQTDLEKIEEEYSPLFRIAA